MKAFRWLGGGGYAAGTVLSWAPAIAGDTRWADPATGNVFAAEATGAGPCHRARALAPGAAGNLPAGARLLGYPGEPGATVTEAFTGGAALAEVAYQGPSFREYAPEGPEAPSFLAPGEPWLFERRIDCGLHGHDRLREEQASGVPPWYRPNGSRRGRRAGWAWLTKAKRAALAREAAGPMAEVRELVGHAFRTGWRIAMPGAWPGERTEWFEAVLYLPAGEKPTGEQAAAVTAALARMAKASAAA